MASDLTEQWPSCSTKRAVRGMGACREVAVTLHELGMASQATGDLDAAASHLAEPTHMQSAEGELNHA